VGHVALVVRRELADAAIAIGLGLVAARSIDGSEWLHQERERRRCAQDSAYFLGTYGKVNDAETLAVIPFAMWPHLRTLLDLWLDNRLSIILKARQLGVSWLLAGYALWGAKFHTSASVLILSKGQADAADVLAKAKFLEANLPAWLQTTTGKDNDSELEFPGHNARIRALPATAAAGRGATASLVLMDELAHHEHARQNLVSISPTIGMHGRLVAVSTANGLGNAYYELWVGAGGPAVQDDGTGVWRTDRPGANGYVPVFLHWSCRPGRDEAWLEQKRAELDLEPLLFKQEYPSTPLEAFVVSGRPVFGACVLEVDPELKPLPVPLESSSLLGLTLYRLPEKGKRHLIGVDVALGLEHGDASCAIVLDAETFCEVAHLHSTQPPDLFAADVHALASAYPGRLAVERNGPGHQVIYKLRKLRTSTTPYLPYFDTAVLKAPAGQLTGQTPPDQQEGWVTTPQNKPTAIGELEAALRNGVIRLGSPLVVSQLRMYQRLANGKTEAPQGKHDDCVMALALAYQMHKWPTEVALPNLQVVYAYTRR
jgi:hypothetical protein